MSFIGLPNDIKKIIFKYNNLDYSYKCKKEIKNFSNKLKFKNVLDELINCFKEYSYINQYNCIDEIIIECPLNLQNLLGGTIFYNNKSWWYIKDESQSIINCGYINKCMTRLYSSMYIDVQTTIKYFNNKY
tara:strand:+ start:843 stop:1235 length:393 start_codon:yes stop_codon:yes gene_type:complete